MRKIKYLVIHCSATRTDREFTGVKKAYPCFDVKKWLQDINLED